MTFKAMDEGKHISIIKFNPDNDLNVSLKSFIIIIWRKEKKTKILNLHLPLS